jgi:hypothetical protein
MSEEKFIDVDFKLPNHSNELSKADDVIEKLKKRIEKIEINNELTDELHTQLFEEVVRVLDFVGRLSMPAFEIEYKLEEMYIFKFPSSPELAKKLWQDHYELIHHPYTILKNRCFKLLEELDEEYIRLYGKNPPNFNK